MGKSDLSTPFIGTCTAAAIDTVSRAACDYMVCTACEIPMAEYPALLEREHRYVQTTIEFEDIAFEGDRVVPLGTKSTGLMFTENTDLEYKQCNCKGSESEYCERVGQYYKGQLWGRTDILPNAAYSKLVLSSASKLSPVAYANFLDSSFLADRTTTLRSYYEQHPDALPTWDE